MQPSITPPLPPIHVKLGEAASSARTPSLPSPWLSQVLSLSSDYEIHNEQLPWGAHDGTGAGVTLASNYSETVKGVRRPQNECTSALPLADATTEMRSTPTLGSLAQASSSTSRSDSPSWRRVETPTATPPSPTAMLGLNRSFFSQKTRAALASSAAAAAVAPLRTHALTARMPSQSHTQRTVAAPAAAPSLKTLLSLRRDSAGARTSVLATARHRRLLPLTSAERSAHKEERDGIVTRTKCLTRESVLKSTSHSSESKENVRGSASTLGRTLCKGHYHPSSQAQVVLSSPLFFNATAATATILGHGAVTGTPIRIAGQHSNGSRLSDTASPSDEGETTLASLTSLQQRLCGWTRGTHVAVAPTTGHGVNMPEPRRGHGRQARSTTAPFVSTTELPGNTATSPRSVKARTVGITTGHTTLAVSVAQWKPLLDSERICGERGKHVARLLIERLLGITTTAGPFGGHSTGGGVLDHFSPDMLDEDEGGGGGARGGHLRPLCERAVVATYLLSSLLDGLPRHQQSLSPYIHMLLDFTFVSDTPTNRAMLGGSVQDDELLYALEVEQEDGGGDDGGTAAAAAWLPPDVAGRGSTSWPSIELHHGSRSSCLTGNGHSDAKGLYELLYPCFTRMTYVAAHYDAARTTVALAYDVRSRELHQRSVPRLLECMHRHWMRWLMRAVLRAWECLCQERRVQEQRQRTRWAQRWTSERGRIALRRWRGYAALTLQIAEADSLAKSLLAVKRSGIERLENESAAMQASSALLQRTLHRQDEERDAMEGRIVQREQAYKQLLQQVREMDRVGSLMLRSLLLSDAPPVPNEADALNGLSAAVSSASDVGDQQSSTLSLSVSPDGLARSAATSSFCEASGDPIVRHPPHTLVALPTLLRWAKACVATVQAEYVSFFPDEEEEESGDDVIEAAIEGNAKDLTTSRTPEEKIGPRGKSTTSPSPCTPSLAGGSNTNKTEATRGPSTGLEVLLTPTTAEGSAPTTRSIAASDTVLVPLHMILLLMRACSGAQDRSAMVGRDGYNVHITTTATSVTITSAEDTSLTDNGDATTPAGPSWDLVRTIELTDRVVLDECRALLRKEEEVLASIDDGRSTAAATAAASASHGERRPPTPSKSGGTSNALASVSVSGVSIMHRLTSATRENLLQVCRVVVDTYEQLTNTACVVTAEQLFRRSRGTLLVLIAALMRYYTNWTTNRRQQLTPLSIKGKWTDLPVLTAAAHEGTKHNLYEEWSHPPHSHRGWLAHVQRQAQWIALSFSALHDAIRVATCSVDALSIIEQERVAGLLQRISLTEFIDLLGHSPEHTMQSYVDVIGVVERYAPSLHLLFHQYALPLAQLRADVEGANNAPTQSRNAQNDDDGGGDAYITGNTVWGLLCLTGLAGNAPRLSGASSKRGASSVSMSLAIPSPPLSATLHRPAVFSLIEQVTQGAVAPTAVQRQLSSMPGGSGPTASPAPGGPPFGSPDRTFFSRRTRRADVTSVSCKGRPIPCYARVLRDDHHVDLRADTGAVCVNYVQFVKLVIRLAHAWQCQQQQQPLIAEEEALDRAKAGEDGSRRVTGSLKDAPSDSPLSGAAPSSCSSSTAFTTASCTSSQQQQRRTSASSDHVQYEAVDYASQLCLPYLNTFLGGLLLPRLLGANRWIVAAQRAFWCKPVLQLLAQHHDALLTVFNMYQRPCESRGVRAALPPPFSTALATYSGRGSTATGTGPALGKESDELPIESHFSQRRLPRSTRSHSGSISSAKGNTSAVPATLRDVGIVSVLRWNDVQAMAKELEWHREARLSEMGVRHCFDRVVADGAREGAVLFFAEFLHLLCAVATYAAPDPAVPLETKLDLFLQTRVLVQLE
ncbi:hypothetical protein, conserved [Leishmania shawi]|uniref:Calponin-homology (CH) domain-containing protein n=1 Tax=Leishmania shawi TaxID=5680 RepID=A0ABR3ECZ4_9TRYP